MIAFFKDEPKKLMKSFGTTTSPRKFIDERMNYYVTSTASLDFAATVFPGAVPWMLK